MPLGDIGVVLAHLRDHAERAGHWQKGLAKVEGLSREGQAGLSALADALAGFDETSSPWDVLAALLLDRTRIAAQIATSASIQDRAHGIAIWQFMNFVRAQPKDRGLPILRLLDRIRRLIRLRDDGDLRQIPEAAQSIDAVRLMTIHGAKGLEFEVVHVPGLNKDTIPRVGTPAGLRAARWDDCRCDGERRRPIQGGPGPRARMSLLCRAIASVRPPVSLRADQDCEWSASRPLAISWTARPRH